jgi:DNA polymerase-3 subunit alpha
LLRIGALESLGLSGDSDKAKVELELLGAYVSVHPLDNYRSQLDRKIRSTTNLNKMSRPYDTNVWVGGLITGVREISTRMGEKMGFVEVTYDGVGKYDIVVFPKDWRLYLHSLLRGRVVLVYGKYQHEKGSIILERLELPAESSAAA